MRVKKIFQLGGAKRLDVGVDIYNLMNASSVDFTNGRYGSQWLRPQACHAGSAFMDGRLFAFSGRFGF